MINAKGARTQSLGINFFVLSTTEIKKNLGPNLSRLDAKLLPATEVLNLDSAVFAATFVFASKP